MKAKRIKITLLVLSVAVVIFCFTLFDACKKERAPLTPEKLVRKIFGRPDKVEDNGSGRLLMKSKRISYFFVNWMRTRPASR
jgi:hypothetical protein